MTIRQKVRLSNILMVLIPIVFTALVVGICLQTSLGSYWHTLQTMYSDENGVQFAQSMIYNYQQELWENNWGSEAEPADPSEIQHSEKMTHLEQKLSRLGYHFYIEKNGYEIFSNMTADDKYAATSVAGEAVTHAKTLTASSYDISVIKNTFQHEEYTFCIVAVHRGDTDQSVIRYIKRYIFSYILGFAGLFIVLSLSANILLSRWISASILRPLKEIHEGTKEIRDGNLDKPLVYHKPDEFGAVCRDFNEMRTYLQESVNRRLEDEQKQRDLIAGISHDLRTPLTSICGYLDGLTDGIADTPEKQRRYFQAIRTRAASMLELVESLSEYSRLNNREFQYHMQYGDLKVFLDHYLAEFREEGKRQSVEVELQASDGCCPVRYDEKEFRRILDNLFTNTVKYRTRAHSKVRILLDLDEPAGLVRFVFRDDGPGVPEESLTRIFDSFYRVETSREHVENGSGIGLAVVKEIVKGHGGNVTAQNQNGLAIKIELPLAKRGGGKDEQNPDCGR